MTIDSQALLQKMKLLAPDSIGLQPDSAYKSPLTLAALLKAKAEHPDAQVVVGCTDVGLWVTKQHQERDGP